MTDENEKDVPGVVDAAEAAHSQTVNGPEISGDPADDMLAHQGVQTPGAAEANALADVDPSALPVVDGPRFVSHTDDKKAVEDVIEQSGLNMIAQPTNTAAGHIAVPSTHELASDAVDTAHPKFRIKRAGLDLWLKNADDFDNGFTPNRDEALTMNADGVATATAQNLSKHDALEVYRNDDAEPLHKIPKQK